MITTIRDLAPGSPDFEWGHKRVHALINGELNRTGKRGAGGFLTGEMDDDWFLRHYEAHKSFRDQLNILGAPPFASSKPDDMDEWAQNHADEHDLLSVVAGLY